MEYVIDPQTGQYVEAPKAGGMPPPATPAGNSSLLRRAIGDPLTAVAKGALVGVPQAIVGLADIATLGHAGKFLDDHGMSLSNYSKAFDKNFSPEHQRQQQEVAQTKGFFPTIGAYLSRPGYLLDTAIEQLPTMYGGAKLGQAAVGGSKAFEAAGAAARPGAIVAGTSADAAAAGAINALGARAGAIGEGVVTAGQNAEQVRQETDNGLLTPFQAATQLAAGAVTGGISYGAGKLANKWGISDVDVLMASGRLRATDLTKPSPGLFTRVGKGALAEGVLEELPQSMQEQVWQNAALGKPLTEGVAEAGATGLVLGGAMGGTVAGKLHNNRVADAVAASQVLAQPPAQDENGQYLTKDHEEALRAIGDLVTSMDPTRRQQMDEWRIEQLARLNDGGVVDYSAVPELAPDSELSRITQETLAGLATRHSGQSGIVEGFGQVGEEVAPQPLTKEQAVYFGKLQEALAAGDMEEAARLQGKLRIPTPAARAPVAPVPTEAPVPPAPAAAAPTPATPAPAAPAPKAPPTLQNMLKTVGKGIPKKQQKDIFDDIVAGNFARAAGAAKAGLDAANADPKFTEEQRAAWQRLSQFVDFYTPQGGANVSSPQNGQGAEPQSAPGAANAGHAENGQGSHAQGNDAAQPAQQEGQVLGFTPGQVWRKGRQKYTIEAVLSEDGKLARAMQGGKPFTLHYDAEVANGWQPEGAQNAVQEPSTAQVDVQPGAGNGEAVGEGNPAGGQAAGQTGGAQAQEVKEPAGSVAPPAPPTAQEQKLLDKAKEYETPATVAPAKLSYPDAKELLAGEKGALKGAQALLANTRMPAAAKPALEAFVAATQANVDALQKRADETRAAHEASQHQKKLEQDRKRTKEGENIVRRETAKQKVHALLKNLVRATRTTGKQGLAPEQVKRIVNELPAEVQAEVTKRVSQLAKKDKEGKPRVSTIEEAVEWIHKNPDLVGFGLGEVTPAVQALLQNGATAQQMVNTLSGLVTNEAQRALAQRLNDLGLEGVKLVYKDEYVPAKNGGWKRGNYDPATNTITIYAGGENAHTVLHEAVHAATVQALKNAQAVTAPKSQKDVQLQRGVAQLNELYVYLQALPEVQGEYGITTKSLAEFVAELHSNPGFQKKLASIEAPSKLFGGSKFANLWAAAVHAIRNLLGIPNASVNALQKAMELTEGLFESPKAAATGATYDAIATPLQAVAAPFAAAVKWFGTMDRSLTGKALANLSNAKQKLGLYLASAKHIERAISLDPLTQPAVADIQDIYRADNKKTQVINAMTEQFIDDYINPLRAALKNSGQAEKLDRQIGRLGKEASRLGIDLTKDFARNARARDDWNDAMKAQGKKHLQKDSLDPKLKKYVDELHAEFMKLKQTNREVADLLLKGFKLNRKQYAMHTSTLLLSALRHMQKTSDKSDPATVLFNKYKDKLDILQDTKGLTNTDPDVHLDALSAKLDAEIQALFADAHTHFPAGDAIDTLTLFEKYYSAARDNPYMHLGRDGMFMVRFDVADNGPATVTKLNKLLGGYGKVFGPFLGDKKSVFLRVDNEFTALEIHKLLEQSGLVAKEVDEATKQPTGKLKLSTGAISDATAFDNAFGLTELAAKIRSGLSEKVKSLEAPSKEIVEAQNTLMRMLSQVFVDMLEVNSARHANQPREGVPGYDAPFLQSFAKRANWAVSMVSNQYAVDDVADAFKVLQQRVKELSQTDPKTGIRVQRVHDELAKRFANSLNPVDSPYIDRVRAFGYHFYLGLSPAFLMVNLLQPYQMTLPLLGGRFGFVKAAKVMGQSSKKAAKVVAATAAAGWKDGKWVGLADAKLDFTKAGLSAEESEFVQSLLRSGVVDASQTHELGMIARGEEGAAATAAKIMSIFGHYSEVNNRLTAGLAAFALTKDSDFAGQAAKLAQRRNVDPAQRAQFIKDESKRLRAAYAVEVVDRTQYNYTDHNTARALGRHGFAGKVTPLFTAFQQYAFQTMEHYIQLAKESFSDVRVKGESEAEFEARKSAAQKALLGTLAATGIIAGSMGLPFATVLFALANAGDDDKDARAKYRAWLDSVFGKEGGELFAHGLFRSAGVDISSRAGHQDLIPGSRFVADRRAWDDKMKDQTKTMFGPAINAGMDVYSGVSHMADGDIAKGIQSALPLAIRGIAKAVTTAQEGYTSKSGQPLPLPVTWRDLAYQSIGFNPAIKAEQSEANFYYQSEQNQRKQDKAKALRQAVQAYERGDADEAIEKVSAHNAEHPDNPISNLGSVLAARQRGAVLGAITGTGIVDSNVHHLPTMADYGWANTRTE